MELVRLEHLKALLQQTQDDEDKLNQFDMKSWIGVDKHAPCKTAVCAIGRAALDPWFQEQGLSLVGHLRDKNMSMTINTVKEFNAFAQQAESLFDLTAQPQYKHLTGFEAVADFFDITYQCAEYLFDPAAYRIGDFSIKIEPYHVIERIDILIANNGAIPKDDMTYPLNIDDDNDDDERVDDDVYWDEKDTDSV